MRKSEGGKHGTLRVWVGALAVLCGVGLLFQATRTSEHSEQAKFGAEPNVSLTTSLESAPAAIVTTTAAPEPTTTLPEALFMLDSQSRALMSNCETAIKLSAPAEDLRRIVEDAPMGACFLLEAGTYTFDDVVPKDLMTFVGVDTETVIIDGSGNENAFHGTASDVSIGRMTFMNFDGSGGEKPQEQAPIRGTSALWKSDRGEMATDWLIESVQSLDNLASGIFVGDHFTVRNSRFVGNGVTGLAGDEFIGGLIEANEVSGNGQNAAAGVLSNGGGLKFTQAGSTEYPVVIQSNEIHHNTNIGVWCDIGCVGFEVLRNSIHDHFSQAVMFELSENALIAENTLNRNNEWTNYQRDWNAGAITIGESSDVVVRSNYIQESLSGVVLRQTLRPARPAEDFLDNYAHVVLVLADVTVSNNTFVDVENTGISVGATGASVLDHESLVFSNNDYEASQEIRFWTPDGNSLDMTAWVSAGNDLNPDGPAGPFAAPTVANFDDSTTGLTAEIRSSEDHVVTLPELPLRVNAGGQDTTDSDGNFWIADRFYNGGTTTTHTLPLSAGIQRDWLYGTERWGASGYNVPIDDGSYQLILHHIEAFDGCQQVGCRIFSIEVEGIPLVLDLDLYQTAAGYAPYTLTTTVDVSDGELTIRFLPQVQNPQLSGFELSNVP